MTPSLGSEALTQPLGPCGGAEVTAGTNSTIRGSTKRVAQIGKCRERVAWSAQGAEEVEAAGVSAPRQLQPPLLQLSLIREESLSAGGVGWTRGGWRAW